MARINKNKINNKINNNDNNNNGSNKGKKTSVLTQLADVEAARQMAKSGVDPAALRLRLVRVNELLHYHCRNCKKEWSSRRTEVHVLFNRDGSVKRCASFRQRCSECVEQGESRPNLSPPVLRKVIARAIELAQRLPRSGGGHKSERKGPPHPAHLCELCHYGEVNLH